MNTPREIHMLPRVFTRLLIKIKATYIDSDEINVFQIQSLWGYVIK